ncbi:MAG: sulfotransferase domain-containing protein [Ekhidna sp.]
MIIWLASYPRSGNTLMRTVLQKCMNKPSYDDQIDEGLRSLYSSKEAEKIIGHRSVQSEWSRFYQAASESKEVTFVKTHRYPIDDQPAIYIVRDGRNAISSYSKFHSDFLSNEAVTLLGLICGLDEYGSWSEHIDAWDPLNRHNTLLFRFEDILDIDRKRIDEIANFINHTGDINPWENPFNQLQGEIPNFFREGKVTWDNSWSKLTNSIYFQLHGEQMSKLGYTTQEEVVEYIESLNKEIQELLNLLSFSRNQSKRFKIECAERLEVINKLKLVCDERLELIEKLNVRNTSTANR